MYRRKVMVDARLGLELKQGYAITFVFATENVLNKWPPMFLPNLPELQQKVRNEMESPEIGVNFAFENTTRGTAQEIKSPVASNSRSRTPGCNECPS